MFDKLIIMNVYITVTSNLGVIITVLKVGRPKSLNILVTLHLRSKPQKRLYI